MVLPQKGAEHESHLMRQINRNTPQFESRESLVETVHERNDGLRVFFLDINKIKNITQRVYCAGWVEVTINVGDALKTFSVKTGLPNKEIRHRGFAEKGKDFLPPPTSSGIVLHRDEVARRPSPIGGGDEYTTR